jgi:hypothetical protein
VKGRQDGVAIDVDTIVTDDARPKRVGEGVPRERGTRREDLRHGFERTQRSVTWVPPTTDSDHGKHQPLQWNIGNVHRYTGKCGMVQVDALHTALR